MAVSKSSGFHTHQSWGRTRRPKALKRDGAISEKETASAVTTVAAGDLVDALNSSDAGKNGYSTENQRFLHIQIVNDDANETLTLYSYNYSFGTWAPLYIPVGAGATANANWVQAQWSSVNGKTQIVVPIDGIDRIAFVDDGTHDGSFIVRAACSTF